MTRTNMAKKTLSAGILVGVVGLVAMLLATPLVNGLYRNSELLNDGFYFLNSLLSAVISFCLPFSAALIAASLVMRHAEAISDGEYSHEAESKD